MSMISELVEELVDNADLYTKELHDLMYRAANAIEMLSEKARGQKWIPCSERLPKEWEHVLVTTDTPYTFNKIRIDWNVDNYWVNYGHHVIAWMLLPEPWKGADDE